MSRIKLTGFWPFYLLVTVAFVANVLAFYLVVTH